MFELKWDKRYRRVRDLPITPKLWASNPKAGHKKAGKKMQSNVLIWIGEGESNLLSLAPVRKAIALDDFVLNYL